MLATILPIVAHFIPEFLLPSLFRVSYTPDELALLIILSAGTLVAANRRFPTWSYTWVILTTASIVAFLTSSLPSLFFLTDFRAITFGWLVPVIHLIAGILVLVFAASRASKALSHTFFIAAAYLASLALKAYVLEPTAGISQVEMAVANSVTIVITCIELVIVLAAVAHFLLGSPKTQRRSIYALLAIALLDPILTGWTPALNISEVGFIEAAGFMGLQVLVRWVYAGVTLLLIWVPITLLGWLRKGKVSIPPTARQADVS